MVPVRKYRFSNDKPRFLQTKKQRFHPEKHRFPEEKTHVLMKNMENQDYLRKNNDFPRTSYDFQNKIKNMFEVRLKIDPNKL